MDAPPQVAAGTLIGGDFRIQRPLSAGGMGAVYVAEQLSTGKPRALKLMHPQLVTDPKSRLRFIDEARVGARIPSEHVVEVVGAGVDEATGVPWLAMELLDGEDLASIVERSGALPHGSARELMLQLGHALGAAHAQGIVHRDLKPENVFVARSRRRGAELTVKVLDFGIAKTLESSRTAATATAALGSPLFMAPEQATPGAAVRPETDVWALGLIGLYALTGRYYWRSAAIEPFSLQALLAEVLVHPMPTATERLRELGAAPSLPPGFDAWFARCVARDPSGRFGDATACVSAFDAMMQGNLHPSMQGQVALASTAPIGGISPAPHTPAPGGVAPPPGGHTPSLGGYTPAPVAPTAHMHPPTPAPMYAPPERSGGGLGMALLAVGALGVIALLGAGGIFAATQLGAGSSDEPPGAAAPPAPAPATTTPAIEPPAMDPIRPAEPEPIADAPSPAPPPPTPALGYLTIVTTPSGSAYVDGRSVGSTPIYNLPLRPGPHDVRVDIWPRGSALWTEEIREGEVTTAMRRISRDGRSTATAPPSGPTTPDTGRLLINTNPWSRISIDGRVIGNTPIVNHELPAGRHEIRAEYGDGQVSTWTQVVEAGETTRVVRRLPEASSAGGATGGTARPSAPSSALPATPSRSDIVSAMNGVSGAVSACGRGAHGLAPVRVTFAGSSGRVTNAAVSGGSFPPEVTSCIARAVRGARVPPFRDPTFNVNYPFRL